MASKKEIFIRLKSVKNTKKITYAMKLVSAAKLRKAQEAVVKSREYTNALSELIGLLKAAATDSTLSHPLMEEREVKRVGLIVVGGSRGLAGGYNTNINKKVESFYRDMKGKEVHAFLLGKKPAEYFRRVGRKYEVAYEELPEDAVKWPIAEIGADIESRFIKGELDEVHLLFTKFKSALSVTPKVDKLLPLSPASLPTTGAKQVSGKILFEPTPQEVFLGVVPRVFRAMILQAALDAKASEQGSRMTAMDSATKNAGDIINKLQLTYNKLRQTGITSELLDIIGGAEATN